jgi:dihydrofolate reductase
MGSVIYDKSMSLDGFIAGANVRLEAGLGDDGERLHDWAFQEDAGKEMLEREIARLGAVICGRRTYDMSIQYWGADGPTGPARVPLFVLSHSVPDDVPDAGVYTFVDEISVHLVPVLFGSGTRMFEDVVDEHVTLELVGVTQCPHAAHLRYRVVRDG